MILKRAKTAAAAGVLGSVLGLGAVIVPVIGPAEVAPSPSVSLHSTRISGAVTVGEGWRATVKTSANLVGLQWAGDPTARFTIDARDPSGRWREVGNVGFEADHRPDPGTPEAARAVTTPASEPVWVGNAREVRVRMARGRARNVVVQGVTSPPAAATSTTNVAGAAGVSMPGIISRVEWRADENLRLANCPEGPDISTNATIAVVHHTGGNNNYGPGDTPAIVRGLYGYATQTLHYCDTHYNFFVDRYGQIFEGRYGSVWDPVRGAHATGMNTGSVGVALIGNFSTTGVPSAAIDALERLLAWKLNWQGVDPTRTVAYTTISGTDRWSAGSTHILPFIVGHRDPGQTGCPGDFLYAQLPNIRLDVARRILTGGADSVYPHSVVSNKPRVAVLSGYGTVYPAGGTPELRATAQWPGWSIARDLELTAGGGSGYVLDGYGGVHPLGSAAKFAPGPYWPNFDIARDLVLRPAGGGYVLDGWGGIHRFGGAPKLGTGPYFPGFDVARKLVSFKSGWYVLDAYGALHPVGGAPALATPYWPGWAIARDVRRNPDGPGGYILDGFGGVWPVGGAPRLSNIPYFGSDVARGFVVVSGGSGYTAREDGSLARFGTAPALSQGRATWHNARPITSPWVIVGVASTP